MTKSNQSCCFEGDNLFACVKNASINSLTRGYEKRQKFGIVTQASRDILDYAQYSFAVNQAYAELHDYIFMITDPLTLHDSVNRKWNKVKILHESLLSWGKDLDYIMWIDADAIVIDFQFSLEEVVAFNQSADIIASAEMFELLLSDTFASGGSANLLNTGTLLVRNSAWSIDFLQIYWTHYDRSLYHDQTVFDLLFRNRMEDMLLHIAILPPDTMNSNSPAMLWQRESTPILHLMGEQSAFRTLVMKRAYEELCRSHLDPSGSPTARQLNCTASNLRQWYVYATYPIYLASIYKLTSKIKHLEQQEVEQGGAVWTSAREVELSSFESLLDILTHLSTRLGTVLLQVNSGGPAAQGGEDGGGSGLAVIRKCFRLLNKYIQISSSSHLLSLHNTSHAARWQSNVYTVAAVGTFLCSSGMPRYCSPDTLEDAWVLLSQALHLITMGPPISHSSLAGVYRTVGQIHLYRHLFAAMPVANSDSSALVALDYFHKAFELYQGVKSVYGDHFTWSLHDSLGQTYAAIGQDESALFHYTNAIKLITSPNRLGADHFSLSVILLHVAECRYRLGKGSEALDTVSQSVGLFSRWSFSDSHPAYRKALLLKQEIERNMYPKSEKLMRGIVLPLN